MKYCCCACGWRGTEAVWAGHVCWGGGAPTADDMFPGWPDDAETWRRLGADARYAVNRSIAMRVPTVWEALPWRAAPLFTPSAATGPVWRVYAPAPAPTLLATAQATQPMAAMVLLRRVAWRWAEGPLLYIYLADGDMRARGALALLALASRLVRRCAEAVP